MQKNAICVEYQNFILAQDTLHGGECPIRVDVMRMKRRQLVEAVSNESDLVKTSYSNIEIWSFKVKSIVDLSAIASNGVPMLCTSHKACRNSFQCTIVLEKQSTDQQMWRFFSSVLNINLEYKQFRFNVSSTKGTTD